VGTAVLPGSVYCPGPGLNRCERDVGSGRSAVGNLNVGWCICTFCGSRYVPGPGVVFDSRCCM